MGESRESSSGSFAVGWRPEPGNPRREGYWDGAAWSGEWREAGSFLALGEPDPTPAEALALRVDHSTGPAWFIATSPLWLFVLGFAVALFSSIPGTSPASLLGLSAVAIFVSGFWDRWLLSNRGLVPTASPLWGLLGPLAYLIARHLALRAVPGRRSTTLHFYVASTVLVLLTLGIMIGVSSTANSMFRVLYSIPGQ